jgi:hypothetical protein
MNSNDVLLHLEEIGERLECLAADAWKLMKAVDEDDPEAEVLICACSAVEELIRRANGKAYDEISDTKRFLNNVRRSA